MRRTRGFSLIELLVVIAIILILIGLVMGAVSMATEQKRRTLAYVQVAAIAAAAKSYWQDLQAYPPDTGNYGNYDFVKTEIVGGCVDECALHRYLALPVKDKRTGVTHGPYLNWKPEHVRGLRLVDGQMVGLLVDPWGQPYNMDSIHMQYCNITDMVEKYGEPFDKKTEGQDLIETKVWSNGTDRKSSLTFTHQIGRGSATEDQDNIASWLH